MRKPRRSTPYSDAITVADVSAILERETKQALAETDAAMLEVSAVASDAFNRSMVEPYPPHDGKESTVQVFLRSAIQREEARQRNAIRARLNTRLGWMEADAYMQAGFLALCAHGTGSRMADAMEAAQRRNG